jgi:Zn-dependent peptidase ImmA (M78 family)
LQRVVLAHELGHAVLHAKAGTVSQFHEMSLFDTVDTRKYEANLFASELLLSDEDVLDALNEGYVFFQAAQTLYVPSEMLDFKFRVMKRKGYKLESPVVSQSDFIKNLEKGFIPNDNE